MSAPGAQPDGTGRKPAVSALKPSEMINLINVVDPDLFLDDSAPGTQPFAGSPLLSPSNNDSPIRSPRKSIHGSLGFMSGQVFEFTSSTNSPRSPRAIKYSEADGTISYLSLIDIVERVTLNPEPALLMTLLRTYKVFCTDEELLDCLVQRYLQASAISNDNLCARVLTVLKEWLERCGEAWETNYRLRTSWPAMLRFFSKDGHTIAPLERAWEALESQAKLGGGKEASKRRKAALAAAANSRQTSKSIPPLPLQQPLQGHNIPVSISNGAIDPLELAKQLTLIDQAHFSQLSLEDCLKGPFQNIKGSSSLNNHPSSSRLSAQDGSKGEEHLNRGENNGENNQNFNESEKIPKSFATYLEWTRKLTKWVTYCILTSDSLRSRVKVFICFLECANHLRSLNNYNALVAIARGLIDPNVTRLKNTTGAFHSKLSSIYQTISQLASSEENFEQLREAQAKAAKPFIPSLELLVLDLIAGHSEPFVTTEIEIEISKFKDFDSSAPVSETRRRSRLASSHSSLSPSIKLLNLARLRQVASTMDVIESAQELAFPFSEVATIKVLLDNIKVNATPEELEQASLYLEPPPGEERKFKKPKILLTEEELRRLQEESEVEEYRLSPGRSPTSAAATVVIGGGGGPAEWAVSLGRDGHEFEVIFIPGYRFYSRDTTYNVRIEVEEDGSALIRAAILEKLIEHLTPAKSQLSDDPDLLRIFFSTFHGYTSSSTVLDLLAMRYQPPHLKSSLPEHIALFQANYETPIRNRVCAVLLYWLRKHPADFTNITLRERVRDFLVEKVAVCQPNWSKLLLTELDARVLAASLTTRPSTARNVTQANLNLSSPAPRVTEGLEILDFEPATVAMQLSLLVHEAWTRIRTSEMMNLSWIGPQAHTLSPNIMAFQGLIEKLVYNVEVELTRLLNANKHENLSKTIGAWLSVAQRSHEHLLCWPVAQSIVMVIHHCYTTELSAVWERIPRNLVKYFLYARALFHDRDRYLDAALAPFSEAAVSWRISTSAPLAMTAEVANSSPDALETPKLLTKSGVLPLDIILEDITHIEESHPNLLLEMGPRVINFEKFRLMSEIFHLVMLTQRSDYTTTKPEGYNIDVEPRVRSWLLREPKPHEIPVQRFNSRFARRVSLNFEGANSANHTKTPSRTPSGSLSSNQNSGSNPPQTSTSSHAPQTSNDKGLGIVSKGNGKDSSGETLAAGKTQNSEKIEKDVVPTKTTPPVPASKAKVMSRYHSAFLPKKGLTRAHTDLGPREKNSDVRLTNDESLRSRPLPDTPNNHQGKQSPLHRQTSKPELSTSPRNSEQSSSALATPSPRLVKSPSDSGPQTSESSRASHFAPAGPKKTGALAPHFTAVPTPEGFIKLVKNNSSFLLGLVEEVISEEMEKFYKSSEIQALIASKRKQKVVDDYKLSLALERETLEGKRAQIKRAMAANFPEFKNFSIFRNLDQSGAVYGFTHPVVLEIADTDVGESNGVEKRRAICDLTTKGDIAHVSLLYRGAALHKSIDASSPSNIKCFLIAESFSQAAIRAAVKCGVELVKIETSPPKKANNVPTEHMFQQRKVSPSTSAASIDNSLKISASRGQMQ